MFISTYCSFFEVPRKSNMGQKLILLPQQESSSNSTRAALFNLMKYDQFFTDPVEGFLLPLKDDRVASESQIFCAQ